MLSFHPFANSKSEQNAREEMYAKKMADKQKKFVVPAFSLGADQLVSGVNENDKQVLENFVENWFKAPEKTNVLN